MAGSVGLILLPGLFGSRFSKLLNESVLLLSGASRSMAFTIILLKAGIMLRLDDLKRTGRPVLLLYFLPVTLELAAWVLIAARFLHIFALDAGIIGAIMGAVSPAAVVVLRMTQLMEDGLETDKSSKA